MTQKCISQPRLQLQVTPEIKAEFTGSRQPEQLFPWPDSVERRDLVSSPIYLLGTHSWIPSWTRYVRTFKNTARTLWLHVSHSGGHWVRFKIPRYKSKREDKRKAIQQLLWSQSKEDNLRTGINVKLTSMERWEKNREKLEFWWHNPITAPQVLKVGKIEKLRVSCQKP